MDGPVQAAGLAEQALAEPDEGIWEIRGPRQRFTYSALMTWVAYDRAGRLARDRGLPAPVERWRKLAARPIASSRSSAGTPT